MDLINESNEFFDCSVYPEKVENKSDRQGITIKGSAEEYLKATEIWRETLLKKDDLTRQLGDLKFKFNGFKKEKDGMKAIAYIEHGDK